MFTKHNNKKNIDISVYKEQYEKVFAPIHKIIFFDKLKNNELRYNYIKSIISDNYHIVPKSIINSFSMITNVDEDIKDFAKNISICTDYLRKILGYSKIKLTRAETKKAKNIITYKSDDFLLNKATFIIFIIIIPVVFIISYCSYDYIKNYTLYCIVSALSIMLISFIILFAYDKSKKEKAKKN